MHGISLVFLNTDGEPLTVRSNASLFCCAVAEKSSQRCREESHRDMARARMKGDMEINPCFLGLMNFILPIYYDNELVAYATGGDMADDTMQELQALYLNHEILCYLGDKTPF